MIGFAFQPSPSGSTQTSQVTELASKPPISGRPIRGATVEHPFATIKYRIFGHPRLLMRGLAGTRIEIGLATMAYNLKRITNVLGAVKLTQALHHA